MSHGFERGRRRAGVAILSIRPPIVTQPRLLQLLALRTEFREIRARLRRESRDLMRLMNQGANVELGPISLEVEVLEDETGTETRRLLLDGYGMED